MYCPLLEIDIFIEIFYPLLEKDIFIENLYLLLEKDIFIENLYPLLDKDIFYRKLVYCIVPLNSVLFKVSLFRFRFSFPTCWCTLVALLPHCYSLKSTASCLSET